MRKLTKKQIAFIEAYLKSWNATQAAKIAGYSERSAYSIGSENLKKPEISEAIDARIAELKMSTDEVLIGLAEHARGSMADFISISEWESGKGKDKQPRYEAYIDLKKAMDNGKLHLLKKIKFTVKTGNTNERTTEIELYDAQAAKIALGRHHRLFADKIVVDWQQELTEAGLDANAEEQRLIEQFKQHLLRGETSPAGVGVEEGEAPG